MNSKRLLFLVLFLGCTPLRCWPPSLSNCGATCFINANLQVLYNIRPLTDYLKIANYYSVQNAPTPYYYTELIRKFEATKNAPVSFSCEEGVGLTELDSACYRLMPDAIPGVDQDAAEFMRYFLNDLITNAPTPLKSYLKTLVQFQQASELICPVIPEKNLDIYSPAPRPRQGAFPLEIEIKDQQNNPLTTLNDCLTNYFARETVENIQDEQGEYRPQCSKQLKLVNSPKILLISLKRFRFKPFIDEEGNWIRDKEKNVMGTTKKIDHSVSIPTDLNVANFVINGEQNEAAHNFDLIGVVVHSGTPIGGHYWAYVKDAGQWYKCDDRNINKVSITDQEVIDEINGTPGKGTGYVLCYQKKLSPQEKQTQEKALQQAKTRAILEKHLKEKQKKEERKRAAELQKLSDQLQQLTQQLQKLNQDLGKI